MFLPLLIAQFLLEHIEGDEQKESDFIESGHIAHDTFYYTVWCTLLFLCVVLVFAREGLRAWCIKKKKHLVAAIIIFWFSKP